MSANGGGSEPRVFLCYARDDKSRVRDLYQQLHSAGFRPWLDEEDLIPGEKWQEAIKSALADSRAVVVCLSPASVSKTGFVQKEIAFALDRAEEMPEGRIYIIPVKLVECELPARLASYHCADLTNAVEVDRLIRALDRVGARCESSREVNVLVHKAFFIDSSTESVFVNVTNVSAQDVEVTHVWFATDPAVHVLNPIRHLPRRLKRRESWETWIAVTELPTPNRDLPYNLARVRLSTGTVAESRKNETVPDEGYVPGEDPGRGGRQGIGEIVVSLAMVLVDVMRMLYVMSAPAARSANVLRYREFIDCAERNLEVLRTNIRLHGDEVPQHKRGTVSSADRRLSGLVGKCVMGPNLNRRELSIAFEAAEGVARDVHLIGMLMPEYADTVSLIQHLWGDRSPISLDDFFQCRLELQDQFLKQRSKLFTIADDLDHSLALPYFVIDSELLRRNPSRLIEH